MPCLMCGAEKTIDAHLIPKAFASEVVLHAGEKHVLAHPNNDRFNKTNTGRYDKDILCGQCDGILGRHEGYVFGLLKRVRAQQGQVNRFLHVKPLDGDTLVKFAAGLCWKFCVTKPEYGRISVGPYVEMLKNVAFERIQIPESIDVAAIQLHIGHDEVYFYRTPLPDRKSGVNIVRFSVGGFVFFLKIDKRRNFTIIPNNCWLRGKLDGMFPIVPATMFEEWTLHAQIADRPNLRSYLDLMRRRSKAQ